MAGSTNGLSSHGSPRRLLWRGFNKPQTLKLGPPRRSDLQHLRHRALTKRRPFRTRSITFPGRLQGRVSARTGLESVKKTHQVAAVGTAIQVGACRPGQSRLPNSGKPEFGGHPARPFNSDPATSTRSGYVIDHGPRNETPGAAD